MRFLLILFVAAFFTFTFENVAYAQLPQNLSGNSSKSLAPDVATEGSNVYVVWYDQSATGNSEVLLRNSTDEGKSFGSVVNISNDSGSSSLPRVAVSGQDVYVVWQDDPGGSRPSRILFRRSLDGGKYWEPNLSSPGTVLSASGSQGASRAAIAVTGARVYIVWEEKVIKGGTVGGEAFSLAFRRSSDQGKQFDPQVIVSGHVSPNSTRPSIAATGSAVYLAWQNSTDMPDHEAIFFRRSLDEGGSWLPDLSDAAVNISDLSGPSLNPSVAAVGASVFISWEEHSASLAATPEIFFRFSTNRGETFFFSLDNVSITPLRTSSFPRMATAGSNFSFVWQDDAAGNFDILLRAPSLINPGAIEFNSKPNINVSMTPAVSRLPSIAMTGSNTYVVWEEGDPGDILFQRFAPEAGAAPKDLSADLSRFSINASVAADGTNVYAAWEDSSNGLQPDIIFRTSTDGGRNFSPPVNLSRNASFSTNAKVAAVGQAVYVVWEDDPDMPRLFDIFFRRSLDRGKTWEPDLSLPPLNLSQFDPSSVQEDTRGPTMAAVGSEVYVAWEDDTKIAAGAGQEMTFQSPQVFFRRSLDQGVNWDPPLDNNPKQLTCVGQRLCKSRMPTLAAAGSNVYLIWQLDLSNSLSINLAFTKDQRGPSGGGNTAPSSCGGSLDEPEFPGAPAPFEPKIAATGSSVYAVWLKADEVFYRRVEIEDTCTFFPPPPEKPTQLSFNFKASHAPAVAAVGSEVYVAWEEDVRSSTEVLPPEIRSLRSKDGGRTYTEFNIPQRNLDVGASQRPSLAAAGPQVYAAWHDNTLLADDEEIFFFASPDEADTFPSRETCVRSSSFRLTTCNVLTALGESVTTDLMPVILEFDRVEKQGVTSVTISHIGPPPPHDVTFGSTPVYYNISTEALFAGEVTIFIHSATNDWQSKIYWFINGMWWPLRTVFDPATGTVRARTHRLGLFAVGRPAPVKRHK